jgi:hypothetical protein
MPKEVVMPFQPEFKESMLTGKKTATTRTRRFGRPGDWFRQFGHIFVLREVYELQLSRSIYCHYKEEGFDSPLEFRDFWNKLHPHIPYAQRPNRVVYLHNFSLAHKAHPSARVEQRTEQRIPLAGVAKPK